MYASCKKSAENLLGWKFRPSDRPTFQEVLPMLRQARIDAYLSKNAFSEANHLWSTKFAEESKVPIADFLEALESHDIEKHERLLKIVGLRVSHSLTSPSFFGEVKIEAKAILSASLNSRSSFTGLAGLGKLCDYPS